MIMRGRIVLVVKITYKYIDSLNQFSRHIPNELKKNFQKKPTKRERGCQSGNFEQKSIN